MHQRDGGVSSAEGIFAPASSASAPGKSAAPGGCGRAQHSQRLSARITSSERVEWWSCWGCDWLDRISSPECNVWEHFRLIIQPIERLGQDALRLWIMSHSVDITNAVDYKNNHSLNRSSIPLPNPNPSKENHSRLSRPGTTSSRQTFPSNISYLQLDNSAKSCIRSLSNEPPTTCSLRWPIQGPSKSRLE